MGGTQWKTLVLLVLVGILFLFVGRLRSSSNEIQEQVPVEYGSNDTSDITTTVRRTSPVNFTETEGEAVIQVTIPVAAEASLPVLAAKSDHKEPYLWYVSLR